MRILKSFSGPIKWGRIPVLTPHMYLCGSSQFHVYSFVKGKELWKNWVQHLPRGQSSMFYQFLCLVGQSVPENCTPKVATGNYRVFYIYLHPCLTSQTMTVFIRERELWFTFYYRWFHHAQAVRQWEKKNIRVSIFKRGSYCIGSGKYIRLDNKYIMWLGNKYMK